MNIKPVLVALMVAAATPAMAADQMPKELIGGWCWNGDQNAPSKDDIQVSAYKHGLCPDGSWMKVTKDGYEGQDGNSGPHETCKLVQLIDKHNLSRNSRNSIYGKFHCYLYDESLGYKNSLLRIENDELTLYEHSQHE